MAEQISKYHPLAQLESLRDNEQRLRAAGFFDAADMYRQFCDGIESSGHLPADSSWVDHGRLHLFGPCIGANDADVYWDGDGFYWAPAYNRAPGVGPFVDADSAITDAKAARYHVRGVATTRGHHPSLGTKASREPGRAQ